MTAHDERQDDGPAAQLRFKIGTRHERDGIKILDHEGQLVAIVLPGNANADLIASLFESSPNLLYGIGRARRLLRAIVEKEAQPDDEQTLAVRLLLRNLHEPLKPKK